MWPDLPKVSKLIVGDNCYQLFYLLESLGRLGTCLSARRLAILPVLISQFTPAIAAITVNLVVGCSSTKNREKIVETEQSLSQAMRVALPSLSVSAARSSPPTRLSPVTRDLVFKL